MIDIKKLNLPSTIGVYLFKKKDQYLYIGKSINIKARIKSHWQSSLFNKKEALIFQQADGLEIKETNNEFQALILESYLIKKHQPKYNVIWKDNKNYLYIKIDLNKNYPKVLLSRKPLFYQLEKNCYYFGPFSSTKITQSLIRDIREIIPFCTEKKLINKPCFYSKIGLCQPCPNYINSLKDEVLKNKFKKDYLNNIKKVINILEGKTKKILDDFYKKLNRLKKDEKYEEAILIRNKIYRLERLIRHPTTDKFLEEDLSLIENKQKMLNQLREFFNNYFFISKLERIECFDISNLKKRNQTASMVVMIKGEISKKGYRKFKIKDVDLKSDFERLKEVITRRFNNNWPKPDLLAIDGGEPQLIIINKLLKQLNLKIPLVGIAKDPDRLIIYKNDGSFIKMILEKESFFKLLINLRDEAHRFAKDYHLYLRRKEILL